MKKLLIFLLPIFLFGCEKYNQWFPQKGEEITLVCEGKESRLNPNFKYTYQEKEIERTYYLKNELTNTNEEQLNIIMSDVTLKSILLNNIQTNNTYNVKILLARLKNSYIIMDEIDDISNPFKCELNFPISESKQNVELQNERIEIMTSILKYIYLDEFRSPDYLNDTNKNMLNFDSNTYSTYYVDKNNVNLFIKDVFEKQGDNIKNDINNWFKFSDRSIYITDLNIFDNYNNYYSWYTDILTKSDKSDKIKDKNIFIKKAYILYNFMFTILPYCITNINRRHFGLYDTTGINKN